MKNNRDYLRKKALLITISNNDERSFYEKERM
mgnify:CR=1 FL=1